MTHKNIFLAAFLLLCLLVGEISSVYGQADTYPDLDQGLVNDFGRVFSIPEQEALDRLLSEALQAHDLEIIVVTIDSYLAYNTGDETIEAFATGLFNSWGIGDPERNDGILILVALEEREVRIEAGLGYDQAIDDEMGTVLNELMLPRFRDGEFGEGVFNGARSIVGQLTGELPDDYLAHARAQAAVPTARPRPTSFATDATAAGSESSTGGRTTQGWGIGILIAALTGVAAWFAVFRAKFQGFARRCHHCEQRGMKKLSEAEDDEYLDHGQRREENIKSIDYDVMICLHCGEPDIQRRQLWFSGYQNCPQCSYRTAYDKSKTVTYPTYTSTGKKQITTVCSNCDYERERFVTIPMKVRHDDDNSSSGFGSSSSSFGSSSSSRSRSSSSSRSSSRSRGSSSGRGSSGKW